MSFISSDERVFADVECQSEASSLQVEESFRALKEEHAALVDKVKKTSFGYSLIEVDDDRTRFYSGLPTFAVFQAFLAYLSPKAKYLTPWNGFLHLQYFKHF